MTGQIKLNLVVTRYRISLQPGPPARPLISSTMSKLNAGAFEFVPGRTFALPQNLQQPPQQLPKPPIERPPQSEAPPPPATITLNIGTSTPPAAEKSTPAAPKPALANIKSSLPHSVSASVPSSQSSSPAPPTNKVYSTERAKTDTSSIAKEVQAVADQEVLKDLFGDGSCRI